MIRLSLAHLQDIDGQAEAAYPRECCGLLAGVDDGPGRVRVTRVVQSPNVLVDEDGLGGMDRFEVDAQVRFDLMRALHGSGERIIGHYHSHPDHPAKPSEHDLEQAYEPDLVWLITAVIKGHAGKTLAWRLNRESGAIADIELEVLDIEP